MAKREGRARGWTKKDDRFFALAVSIVSGPMTEKFIKENPVISRTIQVRGDQTLEDLHSAIFDAFDREDEHMYEFQFGGKGPMDPKAQRYGLPMSGHDMSSDRTPAGNAARTAVGSLGLKLGDVFGYWFDFGDDWWHQISVVAIEDEARRGKYPKVTESIGESPPQYVDWDEEDEE